MSTSDEFDFNIDNYTIDELRELLLLKNDFNEDDVIESIQETTQQMNDGNSNKASFTFLKDVEFKLLTYLEEQTTLDKVYGEGLESLEKKVLCILPFGLTLKRRVNSCPLKSIVNSY